MADNQRHSRYPSSTPAFLRVYYRNRRRYLNRVYNRQSNYTTSKISNRNRTSSRHSVINTGRLANGRIQRDSLPDYSNWSSFPATDAVNENISEMVVNPYESNQFNSNSTVQSYHIQQFSSARNDVVLNYPTAPYSASASTSYVNGEREVINHEVNFTSSVNCGGNHFSNQSVSAFQQAFSSMGNAGESALDMSASLDEASESVIETTNQEQPSVSSFEGNKIQESSAENINIINLKDQGKSSEAVVPVCPVCLETFEGVLKNGGHFVTLICGHVFCNKCADVFKASRKCAKCRSSINPRKIIRLYF